MNDQIKKILEKCAEAAGLRDAGQLALTKKPNAVIWRGALMTALYEDFNMASSTIAEIFNSGPIAVRAAIRRFQGRISSDEAARSVGEQVEKIVKDYLRPTMPPAEALPTSAGYVSKRRCNQCREWFEPKGQFIFTCDSCKRKKGYQHGWVDYHTVDQ